MEVLIKRPKGARKRRKRVGRGDSSGHGTTATRGTKGQKARTGGKIRPGFEGGQMPITRRLPKRGFVNEFKKEFYEINLSDIEKKVKENEILDIKKLVEYNFIELSDRKKGMNKMIKILGDGEITKPITIYTHKISENAKNKILKAGGKIFILDPKVKLSKKLLETETKDLPVVELK